MLLLSELIKIHLRPGKHFNLWKNRSRGEERHVPGRCRYLQLFWGQFIVKVCVYFYQFKWEKVDAIWENIQNSWGCFFASMFKILMEQFPHSECDFYNSTSAFSPVHSPPAPPHSACLYSSTWCDGRSPRLWLMIQHKSCWDWQIEKERERQERERERERSKNSKPGVQTWQCKLRKYAEEQML